MKIYWLAALLSSSLAAQAQRTGFSIGPKAGVVSSVLDGQINRKAFYKTSLMGGVAMRLRPTRGFAFQPELLYVQQGTGNGLRPNSNASEFDTRLSYLNVPLMMKIYIGGVFNIQLGPQVGFLLSAREDGYSGNPERDVSANYKSDFAVCGGIGADLFTGITVGVRLNYGLTDINANADQKRIREALNIGGLHNRSFDFTVGYLFGAADKGVDNSQFEN